MITQDDLKKTGWKKFSWNGGVIIEWWKSFKGNSFDFRIGVRFGEYKGIKAGIVYLFAGGSYIHLLHINSIDHINSLYNLLHNDNPISMQDFVLSHREIPTPPTGQGDGRQTTRNDVETFGLNL